MVRKPFLNKVNIILAILFLSSCATVIRPEDKHFVANEDFAKRLRWADYSGASKYMTEMVQNDFFARFGETDNLRVVEFSIEHVEFKEEGRQADAWYSLEYYRLPSNSVKRKRIQLKWEYQEISRLRPGIWKISSKFPELP